MTTKDEKSNPEFVRVQFHCDPDLYAAAMEFRHVGRHDTKRAVIEHLLRRGLEVEAAVRTEKDT